MMLYYNILFTNLIQDISKLLTLHQLQAAMNSSGIPTIQKFSAWRIALLCAALVCAQLLEAGHALDPDCEEHSCVLCQSGAEDEQVGPAPVSSDLDGYSPRPLTLAIISRVCLTEGNLTIRAPPTLSS